MTSTRLAGDGFFSGPCWLLMGLVAGVSVTAHAKVIAVERADYGATATINGFTGGFGWGSAWTGNNNVVAGSLSRPSVPTSGNRFTTDGNNVGSFRLLATAGQADLLTPGGEFGKEGTTIWVSCLLRRDADSAVGSGRYAGLSFFHNGGAEELLIGIPWEAANWGIHFHDLGANAPGLSTTPIVNGTTAWLVARITFGVSGTTDRVDLFVNPNPTVAPTTPSVTRTGGDIQFTVVRLQSGSTSSTVSFDELHIGTTWADVSLATQQDFPLPLGAGVVHSVGMFKIDKFTQTAPGTVSGLNSAQFEAYAFGWPENVLPPRTNGWYGWFGPSANPLSGWELTSAELQSFQPENDVEERRMFLGFGPFQFPTPPSVEYPTRAELDAVWPDGTYHFDLTSIYSIFDPITTLGRVDISVVSSTIPASPPVIANYARLQAWPRTIPLEIQWQPFVGAGPADFVQIFVDPAINAGGQRHTRVISPPAAESGVIPGTATNYFEPLELRFSEQLSVTVTFFNVTRINTNQYPGCVGIAGSAKQTTVPVTYVNPIVPTLSVIATNQAEGSGAAQSIALEVRLSQPSNTEVWVNYATVNETAIAGEDYQAVAGTLVFTPGQTSKLVQVPITPDTTPEPDETFMLGLSSPVIGTIAQAQAQATILNDDGGGNAQPQVTNPISDTNGAYGTPFNFSIAADAFTDPDAGQTLSYSVGALPPGITFTPVTRTFGGTPTNTGTTSVTVTATDNGTPALSTNDVFDIVITPAPLTVTANDTNRLQGVPNPPLTGTMAGVLYGDNLSATFTTTATLNSAPGVYPISPVFADPDSKLGNYTVTTNLGTLTITSPPELSFSLGGGGGGLLTLSWPSDGGDFLLECTASVTPPMVWQPLTNGIMLNGGTKSYTVTNNPGLAGKFYRLRLP